MEVKDSSPYLPKSKTMNCIAALKTRIAYRVWKRKLESYGRFHEASNFKILEVGCGPGYFLRCMERWFPKAQIVGGDYDCSLASFAKHYAKSAFILQIDAQKLPFKNSHYDAIASLHIIEHLKNPEDFLKEANRVLKRNGFLIIATPNPRGIPARILKDKWQGYRYDHISLRTPHQWREIVLDSGFHIVEDGTTGLTGFRTRKIYELFTLLNWIPMSIFGYFPWYQGECYMVFARKV